MTHDDLDDPPRKQDLGKPLSDDTVHLRGTCRLDKIGGVVIFELRLNTFNPEMSDLLHIKANLESWIESKRVASTEKT